MLSSTMSSLVQHQGVLEGLMRDVEDSASPEDVMQQVGGVEQPLGGAAAAARARTYCSWLGTSCARPRVRAG